MKSSGLSLFVTAISIFVLTSCGGDTKDNENSVVEEVYRPVKYEVVGSGAVEGRRSFSGIAKAGDEIELSFRAGGIITQTNASKGKPVRKGQLVARIDNVEADLAYENAKTQVKSAESAKRTAETELDRVKSMYQKGSASLSEYESAKNAYQNALSSFESAQRQADIQKTQVGYGFIYSPADGIIAETNGSKGERVGAGHVFAILNAGDQLKIELGLPENVINRAQLGMQVEVNFAALVNGNFQGEVIEVSPVLDTEAAVYPVSVEILGNTSKVKPGMAANVTFDFNTLNKEQDDILTVPIIAVGEDANGNFVYVVEEIEEGLGVVSKRTIKVSALRGNSFMVLSGLEGGEKIVTAGISSLLDGQKVKLNN